MPIEISGNEEYRFVLTAFGGVSGVQKGEVDFYLDVADVLVTKTLTFTLNVMK